MYRYVTAAEQEKIDADAEKAKIASGEIEKPEEAVESPHGAGAEGDKPLEDGEIAVPAKPKTPEELDLAERRKVAQIAERLLVARRRMLGNIKFIGELFKKSMLTERIMHTCIMKLLGETTNPDEEDVEALCKLLSTIGRALY